jgi:5'-phosphate synthase pdxT subunit
MVTPISIGIIGIQGAVSEHIAMMKQVCIDDHVHANIYAIKDEEKLEDLQGIILPGGESTTISRFLQDHGLADAIRKRVTDGSLAIMGTCAGCVLLAKHIVDDEGDVHPLRVLDMDVKRNAFGRQRESFEQNILIKGWNEPFPAVFIRAPLITRIHGSCQILSQIDSHIVMVEQEHILAVSFHPELTSDTRIHLYFLSHVRSIR